MKVKQYVQMIDRQFEQKVKVIRTDNAKDFLNNDFYQYCNELGIIHETSCAYTPQQNGVAERRIGIIQEKGRALIIHSNAPTFLWGEAMLTATYLSNRIVSHSLGYKSPYQLLSEALPMTKIGTDLPKRVFGCECYVHLYPNQTNKLAPKSITSVFVGYSNTQKGYKCYYPTARKIIISRDVTFNELKKFYFHNKDTDFLPLTGQESGQFTSSDGMILQETNITETPAEDRYILQHTTEHTNSIPLIPNYSKLPLYPQVYSRKGKEKVNESTSSINDANLPHIPDPTQSDHAKLADKQTTPYPISSYMTFSKATDQYRIFLTALHHEYIPKTSAEALTILHWKLAMEEELNALEANHTWDVVQLPPTKKPIGCRWVFTVKYLSNGQIERYKARLVAQGYSQTYGIDYGETFAPVAKMNTIRILIALAVQLEWPLQQYDIKNAFLHGELEEEIYMRIPHGYPHIQHANQVCKLRKALYGLKQSSRAWFGKFSLTMTRFGYAQSNGDNSLFYKHNPDGKTTILVIYVDDIIITGNDKEERIRLEQSLTNEFAIKNLGRMKYFLGIEVAYSKDGIILSQQKYILDLLTDTGFINCQPTKTPIEVNHKLTLNKDEQETDIGNYQRLIGRLIYLAHTRPDISYVVNTLSQYMHSPRISHLQAAHRVLRYLKGTTGWGLHFKHQGMMSLDTYTDSDFASSLVDRRSTTGYCVFLAGNLVTWRSKKQEVVARSSTEAEFRALAHGLTEILKDLNIEQQGPTRVFCDNQSTIKVAHNPVQHDKMKHVSIDRHYVKETIEENNISIPYISSS